MDATQTRVAAILNTCDLRKATVGASSDTAGGISRIPIGEFVTASDLFDKQRLAVAASLSKGGSWNESNGGANVAVDGPSSAALYCVYNDVALDLAQLGAIALSEEARHNAIKRATDSRESGKALRDNMIQEEQKAASDREFEEAEATEELTQA